MDWGRIGMGTRGIRLWREGIRMRVQCETNRLGGHLGGYVEAYCSENSGTYKKDTN